MTQIWGAPPQPAQPKTNGNGKAPAEPVSVIAAAPSERLEIWKNYLMADGRFRVVAVATELPDLLNKLAASPEVLLLDAIVAQNEPALMQLLTRFQGAAYVVTPVEAGDLHERIRTVSSVRNAWLADVNLPAEAPAIAADALAIRQSKVGALWNRPANTGGSPVGLRMVAVWNQMGGVGKTTTATNLAYESARRGFPTLLIGLGAPDDLPLILGLQDEPNITTWWTNPTPEGMKLSTQKLGTLDVIAGFPDVLAEAQAIATPNDSPNSIARLITTAAHAGGYAVIIVDAPPTALAAAAISACNTLVMVTRPSLEAVLRTAEAYRTVTERLAHEHRIPTENLYLVLNRAGQRLSAEQWHKWATEELGSSFPPIVAEIPDLPAVGTAQDSKKLPLTESDEFARALRPLADLLLRTPAGQSAATPAAVPDRRKVVNLGPLKIKV